MVLLLKHTPFFNNRLQSLQETILQFNAQLVILDSVASLIRKEFESESYAERNDLLAKEATLLK